MSHSIDEKMKKGSEIPHQTGQSLVLIALLLVGILAFAGIATDAGMLFARSSQFSAAVDAAALAGVADLSQGGPDAATVRAAEFLSANGWPTTQAIAIESSETTTALGYPEFNLSVTYPVETYFLGLIGFDEVPVTHSASASIYSWADMPTATQAQMGILRLAGQYIYGPESCSAQGDPVSAKWSASGVPNPLRTETGGTYTYRIRIPPDYGSALEVQLFDPDSLNARLGNTDDAVSGESCLSSGNGDSCFILTGEDVNENPVWLRRLDETWVNNSPGCPIRNVNSPTGDTITRYELFRINAEGDRVDIAAFQTGIATDEHTDLQWVTPGKPDDIPAEMGSFLITSEQVAGLQPDQNNFRNVYLDVFTVAGTSRNGWDIWAGPRDTFSAHDGNERNREILADPASFSTDGIEIFAQGYLPTASYHFDPRGLPLPIASIDQSLGGHSLSLTVFDFEAAGPFIFTFSTMSQYDWAYPRQDAPPDPPLHPRCNGSGDCNNKWVHPPINFELPSREQGDAFYGGYLQADYRMFNDEHVWTVTLPLGRPFLTR